MLAFAADSQLEQITQQIRGHANYHQREPSCS
jgi:hypothetical protein